MSSLKYLRYQYYLKVFFKNIPVTSTDNTLGKYCSKQLQYNTVDYKYQ